MTAHRLSTPGPRSNASAPETRRRFLCRSSLLALAGASPGALTAIAPNGVAAEKPEPPAGLAESEVSLRVDQQRQLFRVRLEMDVKGNVHVPERSPASKKRTSEFPLTSRAVFDYEERYRLPEGAAGGSLVTAAERYYHQATSRRRLNRDEHQVALSDGARQTVVRRETLPETIYAVDDYFSHQELDLLEVPASSMAVDRLLPESAVRVGSTFPTESEAVRSLLNLSSVESNDVQGELVELTESEAKIRLAGNIDGTVNGVPTKLRIAGKLTFDRHLGFCRWLAMAVHETREIGKAKPGFDVAATIKLLRKPLESPIALPTSPRPLQITEPVPAERTLVALKSRELGISVLMNRRWRMMRDVPGSAMMRMIEQDRSIAQCNIRPLVVLPEDRQWTLAALEQQVRQSLGDQLTEFVDASEGVTESGLLGLQVTANGQVEGVPVRWVVIHLADEQGNRALATFTMDAGVIDTFAGSDIQFANSFEFTRSPDGEGTPEADGPPTDGPEVAKRSDSNEADGDQVQSASDLR